MCNVSLVTVVPITIRTGYKHSSVIGNLGSGHSGNQSRSKSKKAPIIRDKRQLGTINTINPQLSRNENINHPAMFPIELPSEYIKAMTNEKDIIADSFLGSGTTMVASHQLNRKCYGMELDEKYCQVIIDRMKKLDSSLVIKINGKAYDKQ